MNLIADYQDFLEAIETAVVDLWRTNPSMTNYNVMRAYEAAIARYNAIARELEPKPPALTGLDATIYAVVNDICKGRAGPAASPDAVKAPAIPIEDMVACLRRLRKSVELWTKDGGRQGYLQFIGRFIP